MTTRARQLRQVFVAAMLLFVCGLLSITAYTLWRLQNDAVKGGLEISAMHTRGFEDFLTQNLHVTELISSNVLEQGNHTQNLREIEASFVSTLHHTPFLRSMSLVDEQGRVFASSNPANIGISVAIQDFLPPANESSEVLRIGSPWAGRDFASGKPSTTRTPLEPEAQSFIPIARSMMLGKRNVALLFALNPDYFINQVLSKLPTDEGVVEVLRYDGTLLMNTDPNLSTGSLRDYVVHDLRLSEIESGKFEKNFGDARQELMSFRASRLYPFVVVTRIHRAYALKQWRTEALTLLAIVIPALLSAILIAIAYYRRQLIIAAQRTEAEHALRRESEKNLALLHNASDGIHILDPDGNVLEVSNSFCDMLGYSREEMLGMNVTQWDATFTKEEIPHVISRQLANKGRSQFETRHRRKDGAVFDVEISGFPLELDGKPALFNSSRDITERKRTLAELRVAATAFESQDGILVTDADRNILRVNPAFTDITGYSTEEVIGKNPRVLSSGRHDSSFYAAMWESLNKTGAWKGEIWNRRKNGDVYPERLTITAVTDQNGNIANYVASLADITQRKAAEEEIKSLAFYDPLTQLPNRRLLMDRLHSALALSTRSNNYGALLFLDMDRFKTLNDTLGHDYGDLLLVEVAKRIQSCVREADTVARLGGDEFVVLLEEIDVNAEDASRKIALIAEKIRIALTLPYLLNGNDHHSSPSIGVCLYRGNEASVDTVLKHADMAMYQAKESGRNAVRFFDPAMQLAVETRVALDADLRYALPNRQLHLYYQIQVDDEHRALGAEALIRWIHPTRGLVSPLQFIPIAEESSLILDIGHWVLDTACLQLSAWAKSEQTRHLTLAVNVSAQQFKQHDFVDRIATVLRLHEIEASRLKLELTESVVLNDVTDVVFKMHALKALGVGLSLDDFGTGYSSLSYLKQLPLDQIKIDQGFVRDIATDMNDAVMVQTIIDLAKNFRLNVIAEGVETKAQLDFLKQNGCLAYQGYLFSKPIPMDEFELLLKNQEHSAL